MLYAAAIAGSAFIGLLIASVELLGRYRAFPGAALLGAPGFLYLTVNAAACMVVFALSTAFGWRFGVPDSASVGMVTLVRVIVSGFSAMALLRSSLFTLTQGETTVDAGPSALLNGLRSLLDRLVDQQHTEKLILREHLLTGLSFAKDHEALTLLCSTALVNPDPQSAEELGDLAAKLKASADIDDAVKLQIYAMKLLELAGSRAVEAAGKALRASSGVTGEPPLEDPVGPQKPQAKEQTENQINKELAWEEAHRIVGLLDQEDRFPTNLRAGQLRVDLRLLLAYRLRDVSSSLAALAFSELKEDLPNAELVFGAETVLSRSPMHVGNRLMRLLAPPPVRRVAYYSPGGRGRYDIRTEFSPPTGPAWLLATALDELGPHLDDELALAVLDASIELADLWDVRVARAAVHLRLGNREQAATDIDEALRDKDLMPDDTAFLLVAPQEDWDGVLRPVRDLLASDVSAEIKLTLWNAAVKDWIESKRPHRREHLANEPFTAMRSQDQQLFAEILPQILPPFLSAVAAAVPPRGSQRPLSSSDFTASAYNQVPETFLPEEVLEKLHAKFGEPPSFSDESLEPSHRRIADILEGSPQEWEQSRSSDAGQDLVSSRRSRQAGHLGVAR